MTTILILCIIWFIGVIALAYYHQPVFKRREHRLEETRLNEKLAQVELETLHAKINPQFLHHSLKIIADTALQNGESTREMSLRLSRYFRYCMNKEARHWVTPDEEAEMTRIFLEFEQFHFPGKLEWQIALSEEIAGQVLPRLLLQSLTDFCIRQACKTQTGNLCLEIGFQSLPTGLILRIVPRGLFFSEVDNQAPSLQRIRQKLDLILLDAYVLNIHPAPVNEILVVLKKR